MWFLPARAHRSRGRRRAAGIAVALTLTATTLVACGSSPGAAPAEPLPEPTRYTAEERAGHNDTDVDFAQMMLVHTRQSTAMVTLARERSSRADVLALAEQLAAADDETISAMTELLEEWGEEVPDEIALDEMDHSAMDHTGIGVGFSAGISDDQVTLLAGSAGDDFDDRFLKFIFTHRGAGVAMAQSERIYGQSGQATKIAKELEAGQADDMDAIETVRRPA